ncbi:hypothetical protein P3L10_001085 [Capsicum annuum]
MIPRGASELALDAICQGEDETIKLQLCFQMHIIWIHSIYDMSKRKSEDNIINPVQSTHTSEDASISQANMSKLLLKSLLQPKPQVTHSVSTTSRLNRLVHSTTQMNPKVLESASSVYPITQPPVQPLS